MYTVQRILFALIATFVGVLGFSASHAADPATQPSLVVNQWVRQDATFKALTGRIVVPQASGAGKQVAKANVALVDANGKVRRAKTNASGTFTFQNVNPGIYSLTARGQGVFSIVALHVVDSKLDGAQRFPTSIVMPAAEIDFASLNSAIVRYMPPKGLASPVFSMASANLSALADRVVGSELFQIAQVDGGMSGQLFTPGAQGSSLPVAGQSNVFIIRDGKEVARTLTGTDGKFMIANLPEGSYSILAVGPSGLGLVGVELVSAASIQAALSSISGSETLVAQPQNSMGETFAMQVAGTIVSDTVISQTPIGEPEFVNDDDDGGALLFDGAGNPIPGGGGGFGPTGGGGFGAAGGAAGGIGGAGPLLGLAVVGGIVAAAVGSDNNNNDGPPVATPGAL